MMGMDRQSAQEPGRERGTGMSENQLLFLIRLCDLAPLFLHCLAFYLSSSASTSLGRGNVHLASPRGWNMELTIQKT